MPRFLAQARQGEERYLPLRQKTQEQKQVWGEKINSIWDTLNFEVAV